MPVTKQFISTTLDKSINTKLDPKTAPFPGFSLIEDGIRTRAGEVRKRFGYDQIPLTSSNYAYGTTNVPALTQSANYQMLSFESMPAIISKATGTNDQYIYRNYNQNSAWNAYAESRIPKVVTTNYINISQNTLFNASSTDIAISGNIACVVYDRVDGSITSVFASFYDVVQNTVLKSDVKISNGADSGFKPRVVANGTVFQIFFLERAGSPYHLSMRPVNIATGLLGTAVVLDNNVFGPVGNFFIDATFYNSQAVVAYQSSTQTLKLIKVNSSGTITATNDTGNTVDGMISLSTLGGSTLIYVAYVSNVTTEINLISLDTSLIVQTLVNLVIAPSAVINFSFSPFNNNTQFIVYCSSMGLVSTDDIVTKVIFSIGSATIVSTTISIFDVRLASKLLNINPTSTIDIPVFYLGTVDVSGTGTLFITSEIWASVLKDTAATDKLDYGTLPSVVLSGTRLFTPVRVVIDIDAGGNVIGGIGLSIVETSPTFVSSVEVNDVTLIGGGIVRSFDGYQTSEVGWQTAAIAPILTIVGSGGNIAIGSYQYSIIYEWVDAKGNIYRSPPSIPVTATIVANNSSVILRIQEYGITTHNQANGFSNTHGKVVVYRTTNNGSIFFENSNYELKSNDATQSFIITDTLDDASLGDKILYTTGNVLENEAPPAAFIINTFQNRVFLVPSESRNTIWYSKVIVKNEGIAFSSFLIIQVDPRGGDIVAISEMDDKIVIFKEHAIFYTSGTGANDIGQGGYNNPVIITGEFGCNEPRSAIRSNDGVIFKSPRGIWMVSRGLQMQYIGAPIELYKNLTITSAINFPSLNQTRFSTSDGGVLVYENLFQEWYIWTGLNSTSAINWGSDYALLKTDGNIWRENQTLYTDNTAPVVRKIITFPIQVAQIQGYQRLFRIILLGEWRGVHTAKCYLAYDNKEYFEESFSITPTSTYTWTDSTYQSSTFVAGGTTNNVWQFEIKPKKQACSAVRIMIVDDFTGLTAGDSFTLSSIGFEIGALGGRNRVVPTTKVMT